MAKETKTITLRLPVEQMEYLEQFDCSTNQAVVDLIDKVKTIDKYADRDIQGVFSESEWKYLADSLNGTMVEGDFRFMKGALVAGVEDSATYDNLDKKWGVSVKTLSDKINALSSSAIEAIYRRVENFWKNSTLSMEEWAKY